jgi:hypothetical protein
MSGDGQDMADDVNAAESPQIARDESAGIPDFYVIPRALAQATLEYLAAQPYREVFTLVRGFEALEPLPGRDSILRHEP